jgi:hypothetical protein
MNDNFSIQEKQMANSTVTLIDGGQELGRRKPMI